MNYLSVISLDDAKEYLRVEHGDSDREIERMIKSALALIEEKTRHLFYDRDVTYRLKAGVVHVYDGPINTVGTTGLASTVTRYDFTNYSVFTDTNTDNLTVALNVGYADASEIPSGLIQAALEILDYWYYKNDGTASMSLIGNGAQETINSYSRFIF